MKQPLDALFNFQKQIEAAEKANYWERPKQSEKGFLFMFACRAFLIFGGIFPGGPGIPLIDKFCIIIGIISSVLFGWLHLSETGEYRKALRDVEENNAQEMNRLTDVVPDYVKKKKALQRKSMTGNMPMEQHLKAE